jgi:hypothetical protein
MPLLGGLFGKAEVGPVVIPVLASIPVAFRVYYVPGYPPLLPDDLRARAIAWLEAHVEEPMRSALRPVLASPDLSYTDMAKTSFPAPLEVLAKTDVGAEERERFEAAWQVTVVACQARPEVPMFGLWAAIAAGRSAATDLKGALFDAAAVRLTPVDSYQRGVPGTGVLTVTDHAVFGGATDSRGLVRWSSAGMPKFGLPEVEIQEAPAGLDLGQVLRDLAQHLLDQLLTANHGREQPVTELSLGPEISLPLAGGTARFRIIHTARQGDLPPIIDVLPTLGYRGTQSDFLVAIAAGKQPERAPP